MTKYQVLTLMVNLALGIQITRKFRALNNAGGEDAMGLVVEICFYLVISFVFDLIAFAIQLK